MTCCCDAKQQNRTQITRGYVERYCRQRYFGDGNDTDVDAACARTREEGCTCSLAGRLYYTRGIEENTLRGNWYHLAELVMSSVLCRVRRMPKPQTSDTEDPQPNTTPCFPPTAPHDKLQPLHWLPKSREDDCKPW